MPKLSVVVPVYNVAGYLRDCLTSLARQTVGDLEVICVDDGSTDGGAEIVTEYAARDPRFRLVRQDNAGPGAARNTGLRHVTGTYLAFADGDDVIPATAFELLIGSLEETGSDIALGNTLRLTPAGTHQSALHKRYARRPRRATHVTRDHELLQDRVVWGRVYRTEFWRANAEALAFPEGMLHEDIRPTIRAHYLARTVDVLHQTVYLWRIREGGEASTTQRRTDVAILRDRFRAVDDVSRFLAEHAPAEDKRRWDEIAVATDLRIFLRELHVAPPEFAAEFLRLAGDFLGRTHPRTLERLPAIQRLQWNLVERGLLPELLEALRFERAGRAGKAIRRGLRWYGDYPFRGDRRLGLPDRVFRLRRELRIRTRVHGFAWEDGRLRIDATAHIAPLGATHPLKSPRQAVLVRADRRRVIPVPTHSRYAGPRTESRPDGEARGVGARGGEARGGEARGGEARGGKADAWAPGAEAFTADPTAYSITVDPRRLRVRGRWADVTWQVGLAVFEHGVLRKARVAHPLPGPAQSPPYRYVADGVRLIPMIAPTGALQLRVEVVRALATACRMDGDELVIEGRVLGPRAPGSAVLHLRRRDGAAVRTYPAELDPETGAFAARVGVTEIGKEDDVEVGEAPALADDSDWQAGLLLEGAHEPVRLVFAEGAEETGGTYGEREVWAVRSRYGYLTITDRVLRPVVREAAWGDAGVLRLTGRFPAPASVETELVLSPASGDPERRLPIERDGDAFTVRIPAAAMPVVGGGTLPLPARRWRLRARNLGPGPTAPLREVLLDHDLVARTPTETTVGGRRYVFTAERYDMGALIVHSGLRPDERGSWWQSRLRTRTYPRLRAEPLRDAVFLDSYKGRQFSDNPRAIHEELVRRDLGLELIWAVDDDQAPLPEGVRPVRMWSREWYEAMARSRYLVSNMFFPDWYRRRPGQVVLQTWHGTPLKRLGFDVAEELRELAVLGGVERVREAAAAWDLLVSPNPFSTPIWRSAFRYEGEIIESGYPRNDVLHRPGADARAREVRGRLGISPEKKVVLYAPTWREGTRTLDLRLDLARAREALGADHLLLVRTHQYVTDRIPGDGDGFVLDVSAYPDIADLYLIADVFVTDYSSSMFDFAGTRKPMLFFTYDYEDYRDRLRGMYFDFTERAPGPLLRTSDALIEAIGDAQRLRAEHAAAYEAFTEDFCPWDDGQAARRVADRLLK